MQFDWEQLGPTWQLGEDQKSLVREIGETFLNTGTGVSDHQKRVQLRKNRDWLNDLVRLGLAKNIWNHYYPTFGALYFSSPTLRDDYAFLLDLILKTIKALYDLNPA